MEFRILGPLEVVGGGDPLPLGSAQQRAVLALLVVCAPEPVAAERLVDELWGERPPASAQHAVQVHVSAIRRLLRGAGGEAAVRTASSGYVLDIDSELVDARRFERLLEQAQRAVGSDADRARTLFAEALALWRGRPLTEFEFSELACREGARLEELRTAGVEGLVEASLLCGEHGADVIAELSALVAANPLRERPRRLLMLALYRAGRHAEALAAYRDACAALDEIGLQPGPELGGLEQAILRHDPSLGAGSDSGSADEPNGPGADALRPTGTVSLLFTDIEGSTRWWEIAPDAMRVVLDRHNALMREAIESRGGYVFKTVGDAFCASFADPAAALEAAVSAQRRLALEPWPEPVVLRVRMAIHTGVCHERDGDYFGPVVNRVARLEAAAHGGQLVLSAATAELVRTCLPDGVELADCGPHRLKGLGTPEQIFEVFIEGLPRSFPPLRTLDSAAVRHNLPGRLSELVGREMELDRLRALLSDGARLVTLVGVGGVGKTRLALAAGWQLLNELPGGAFVVALAAVGEPAGVLPAVARAIGVHDVAGDPLRPVLECIGERPMLLILDNFEQILAAGPLAGDLVAAAPSLRIIVTSQAPLRIGAETVVAVDALTPTAAVELFIERAAAIAPGVAVSEADRSVIAEICERVGRLPLAVELAAARMRVLAPHDLLGRLEGSSAVLRSAARDTPERQRSLRATLEWTHAALSEEQRTLFRRLGVFAGPVPVDAIEAVAEPLASERDSEDTLDALGGIVDFSLVHRDQSPTHGVRFSMPQALRDFAREKLTAASETDAVNRRHAQHISDLGDGIRLWFGATPSERGRLLAVDSELSPALVWTQDHDRDLHRRVVAGLGMMLIRRGRVREATEHLAVALEGVRAPTDPSEAWLGNVWAYGLLFAGRTDEAWAALEPIIAFDRERGDERELALALQTAGWLHIEQKEFPAAMAAAEESLELVRRVGEPRLLSRALSLHVQALIDAGLLDRAEQLLDEAPSEVKERTFEFDQWIATQRGDIALAREDHARALDHYATSLALAERLGEAMQIINDGLCIAWLLNLRGHTEAALEADALIATIARDAGRDTNAVVGDATEALAAVRETAGRVGTEAADRAAAIAPADRISRILALTEAAL